ncbi:hypothetical protein VSS74_28870 [Conexibacter stalactiti]|uniref:Lipoprotein n=1 Tax=Conexibacter stalactiti TaxID=1940611 RepID=A0ABU4HYK9_9ACTN|nr:hypothetical protein [Conexibacter stalactiti]MDW5598407.1 hypothetical protein [Conexibacter stalactiti]MEC5039049.1 hypothetical protein [Conexibacter stalactiti]
MLGRRSLPTLVAAIAALLLCTAATAAAAPPAGRYAGKLVADNVVDSGVVHFTVSRDGRRLTGWRVTMNVVCASLPVRVELITQTMPAMTIARDGRFRSVYTRPVRRVSDVRIAVSGRFSGSRVVGGKIDYDVGFSTGTCTRKADWTAAPKR